jgi:hypothetical protein
MRFLRNNKPLVGLGGVVGLAVAAWLAFGFFGVQALFLDQEVDEADPFALETTGTVTAAPETSGDIDAEGSGDGGNESTGTDAAVPTGTEGSNTPAAPTVTVESSGSFIGLDHPAAGDVTISTDGTQRFLRFENFETDNGPDLFVYLVAGAGAEGDPGLFDDDFVNLGPLTGNIGDQNYEVGLDVDLDRYTTVVIWCDRFNSAFGAADLT